MERLFIEVTPENEKKIREMRAWPQTEEELKVRTEIQKMEMASALNLHGTREEFGISPEEEENEEHHVRRMLHYIHSGRPQEIGMIFDLAFSQANVHGANLCTGCEVKQLPVELRVGILAAHLEFMLDIWRRYPLEFEDVFGLCA